MKFKVGDKVVRTAECSDYHTVKQGGEYSISKVDDECNSIYLQGVYDFSGQPDWFNPDNFELVEAVNEGKQMSKFKSGDKVLCVKPTTAMGVNVGYIYTIKNPESHNFGKGWHVILEEVISTPNENVLELYEENVVKQTENQTPFEKNGWTENSIFKVVGNSCSHEFDIGSLVVLHRDNGSRQPCFKPQEFHGKEADYDEDCWYMYFHDLVVIGEVLEQGTEQQKGVKKLSTLDYADKSIFKVINDCGSCFEVGDLVVIDSECGDYGARFKLVREYGQYRKPYVNWLTFEGLEYVGELGSDMVKENTAIQKDKAYRKMSPDTLIPISIDGNDFEVSLGGLLLARYIIGEANGSYLYSLYCALDVIDKEDSVVHFESQNPVDCSHYQKDLFSKYFKDEVKESKKLEIKAQIESLQEQLKTLD